MTTITQLPVPPTTTDPDNFDPRADAFVGALPQFVTETNQVALEVMANRQAAEAASDATPWFAGTIYNQGDVVYSPSNYLSYRDSTGGLSNTDPAMDPRWVALNGQGQNLDAIEATLVDHENRLDAIEAEPGNTVFDEGVATVSDAKEFNFVGAGVTVTQTAPGRARVSIPGTDLSGVNQALVEHDQRLDALEAEPDLAIRDEGMQITASARSLNFAGAGVTANSDPQGNVTVSIPGGGAGGNPLVVQDEGMQIEDDALTLNFAGAGVTATSVNGLVTVTIPGGGGGSTSIAVDDEGLELTDMLTRLNFVGGGVVATETSPGVISVSIPGQTPITAADEGTQIEDDVKSINFTGAGVTATSDPSGNLTVSIPGGGAGGNPLVIQDEGQIIEPDATTLNFVGDLVIVTSISPGFAQVRVRGPQIFDSPAPGTQGVSVKQSATMLELGPNIEKATFGNDGRVYLNAVGVSVADEGTTVSPSNEFRSLNFIGAGVTASTTTPGVVDVTIPGGGGGGGSLVFFDEDQQTVDGKTITSFNVVSPGVSPRVVHALGSVESAFAVTGGNGTFTTPVDLGQGAVNMVPDSAQPTAKGVKSVAIGHRGANANEPAFTNAILEVAINGATNGNGGAIAIGGAAGSIAGSGTDHAIALGSAAQANHRRAMSIGSAAQCTGENAISIGRNAIASSFSQAFGEIASATGAESLCIGGGTVANQLLAMAIGSQASVASSRGIAFGQQASIPVAAGNSVAIGYLATVDGADQIQLGNSNHVTYTFGAVQNRSDARDKTDVRDSELGLDFIMSLRPVDYRWDYRDDYFVVNEVEEIDPETGDVTIRRVKVPIEKDGSKVRTRFHHGFIAQEVDEIISQTGKDFGGFQDHSVNGGGDILSLGYEEFIAPLVKAVQQQQSIIKSLEARLAALEGGAA